MFSTSYTYMRRTNVKTSLLSAMLIVSMFAVFAPVAVTSVTKSATPPLEKLAKSLTQSLVGADIPAVDVVVETVANAPVVEAVEEIEGEVTSVYESVEALAASVPTSKLLELASNPNVIHIYNDEIMELRYGGAVTEEHKIDIPLDPLTNAPVIETELSEVQVEPIAIADIESIDPSIYHNSYLTHADEVWAETSAGEEATVAIIDTGVWSASPLLDGNVIGGIDLSPDQGTPLEGYDAPWNHYHGTACSHLLAAHAYLIFSVGHPWAEAILMYDPEGTWNDGTYIWVTCLGIAPAASIYGIKVFPSTGAGVPSSIIMDGIDHAIQKKLSGEIDIDVISMSLGGGVGADGEDPSDLLVDAATEAGITVVVAAGNDGPAQLRVGSPGSAKTAITVGAAMDPIHERVFGDIAYGLPGIGAFYYPHEEKSIVDFSSRGPSADGRIKPEVVATGSWCFLGLFADGYIRLGGGTSYSCPQVAGEAALLTAYIEHEGLTFGPCEIKQAIYDGAQPIPGFSELEQGAGYINVANSLDVIKSGSFGTIPQTWPHHFGCWWFPPIDTTCLGHGEATIHDLTLAPGKYMYFAFWVTEEVDSITITLSDVELADPSLQNPYWGDAGVIYLSSSERGGIDEYFYAYYFFGDGEILLSSDVDFQPGLVRLVLAGDFSSYESVYVGEVKVEVTELWVGSWEKSVYLYNRGTDIPEAQVEVYSGKIETYWGTIKEGETDTYTFEIPDGTGVAYVILSWWRDWSKWATSDLDLYVFGPYGSFDWTGATAASPEATIIDASSTGTGEYTIDIEGYQVYFNKKEYYTLKIIYLADPSTPLWSSDVFSIHRYATVRSPEYGVAIAWIHDLDFDYWYIGGFTLLERRHRCVGTRGSGHTN